MSQVNHSERQHALLSASGSHRWMACTPSARFEDQFPDTTSVYAEEGTLAHEICDVLLNEHLGVLTVEQANTARAQLEQNELFSPEMYRHADNYFNYCVEKFNGILRNDHTAQMYVEERLDYSQYVPEGFGTGDNLIVSQDEIIVTDYKYGRGVRVNAKNNPQLMLYGLGALEFCDLISSPRRVTMRVFQPRLHHTSEWTVSADNLRFWGECVVKPKAELAFEGKGAFAPGAHCQFCRGKHRCRALAEHSLATAKENFSGVSGLTDAEILKARKRIDTFDIFAKAVRDYMHESAIQEGKRWPGWRLVEGQSRRKIIDEDAVRKTLKRLGCKERDIMNKKLKSLKDLADQITVDEWEEHIKPYIGRYTTQPTLVPEDDPRPTHGLQSAIEAFSEPI